MKIKKCCGLFLLAMMCTSGGLSFADSASGSSDAIAPGDMLSIRVFGDESLTAVWHGSSVGYTVDNVGNLNFPLLGEVKAAGLSIDDLQKSLESGLAKYLVYPKVNASFHNKEIGRKVSILGQVTKPGTYDHRQGMTITQLISEAGDFTRISTPLNGVRYVADMGRVQVVRKGPDGKRMIEVNVGEILAGARQDFAIEPSDLVVVLQGSSATSVSLLGEVAKPGNYELGSGMTLLKLISDAQGFTRLADPKKVVITSSSGANVPKVVDAQSVLMGRAPDVALEPGDVVFVPESAF